ncbi:MAG: hypothetical protein HOF89_06445, partial [Candidatus Nitrosopelagicus sp.]|nr:hypothetical protein [Candidatus Nitrosopelagicus sp.]
MNYKIIFAITTVVFFIPQAYAQSHNEYSWNEETTGGSIEYLEMMRDAAAKDGNQQLAAMYQAQLNSNNQYVKQEVKSDKIYTYVEIYSITDQAGLDCDNKHGPPFGSMNQQSAWNNCHNNVNTWELNQLDRTDYYGEPQRESSGGGCL